MLTFQGTCFELFSSSVIVICMAMWEVFWLQSKFVYIWYTMARANLQMTSGK